MSFIKYILINKDLEMLLPDINPTQYPLIQLNDLKGIKMTEKANKPQYSNEQLESMTDWIEIPRPFTEEYLKDTISKGYILKSNGNEYVYTDSKQSWFIVEDREHQTLKGALFNYAQAQDATLLRSSLPMTDIANPSEPILTLNYLNSIECLIELNSHEDALFLESIGVSIQEKLMSEQGFKEQVEEWSKPILLEDHNSWSDLSFYKNGTDKRIVTIEEIKKSFRPPATKPVWKNPKPTKKNTQPIKKGMYFLVDGKPFPQTALEDTGDIANKYPIHMLQPEQPLKVGDIICNGNEWSVIKNKGDKSKAYDSVWRVTDEKNKAIQVIELEEYACGTLFDTKSQKILKELPEGVKIESHYKDPLTFEHHEISRTFNVALTELKSQDDEMHKKLKITLDHPLNVTRKEWAYIWGPSGSGKSTLAINYAEKTGKKYILQQGTSQLTVDDLLGYKSITTGKYFPSLLRDAVENGKVFILDEADACNGNTLLCLNALKNKTFQFPDKEVTIHPEFRLIMTANTFNEYSEEYNSRNPLDKATLSRCSIIEYDMKDYHLALRYGLKYISQIELENKSPREIEREVVNLQIQGG